MIGIIGTGNMGKAIIGGITKSGIFSPENIIASDKNQASLDALHNELGVSTTPLNAIAAKADVVLLAVKPQFLYDVISEIKDSVSQNTIIISIAAGQKIEKIEKAFGKEIKLVRVMPNTPALVGEGMSALSPNKNMAKNEITMTEKIFTALGKVQTIPENLMDAVTAVSGSAPAYIFMLIEAMADAAVKAGMPREQSYTFAAQAVLGSAKMVLETNKHPAELKDMVCSPGGTTIEAVKVLEDKGFRAAIMDAMEACVKKSQSL